MKDKICIIRMSFLFLFIIILNIFVSSLYAVNTSYSDKLQNLVNNNKINSTPAHSISPTPVVTPSPCPTPTPSIDVMQNFRNVSVDKDIWGEGEKVKYQQLPQNNLKKKMEHNQSQNNNNKTQNPGTITSRVVKYIDNSKLIGGASFDEWKAIGKFAQKKTKQVGKIAKKAIQKLIHDRKGFAKDALIGLQYCVNGQINALKFPYTATPETYKTLTVNSMNLLKKVNCNNPDLSGEAKAEIAMNLFSIVIQTALEIKIPLLINAHCLKPVPKPKASSSSLSSKYVCDVDRAIEVIRDFNGQRAKNIDDLYRHAQIADIEVKRIAVEIAQSTGGKTKFAPEGGLKCKERALVKAQSDYDGDVSRILDVSRATIVYDNPADLYRAIYEIQKKHGIVRIKDRFIKPQDSGYRDVMLNIETANGHVAELQLHLKSISDAKGLETPIFNERRTLPKDSSKHQELLKKSQEIYGDAYKNTFKGN